MFSTLPWLQLELNQSIVITRCCRFESYFGYLHLTGNAFSQRSIMVCKLKCTLERESRMKLRTLFDQLHSVLILVNRYLRLFDHRTICEEKFSIQ